MFGNINPRQMEKMMKQMGMKQEEVEATQVIIKTVDKEIVFPNPQVSKINMMGQDTWQITGEYQEQAGEAFTDEDIDMVMQQAGVDKDAARKALEEASGDIAAAIVRLKA